MFITTFAADLQLSKSDQALSFSVLQISNFIGTYVCGWLGDQGFNELLLSGIATSTSLTHFLLWGFCKTRLTLFIYAFVIGFVSGGRSLTIYSIVRSRFTGYATYLFPLYAKIAGSNNELFTTVHSIFSFGAGFAILSVGPIGAEILRHSPPFDESSYAVGKYQASSVLILF